MTFHNKPKNGKPGGRIAIFDDGNSICDNNPLTKAIPVAAAAAATAAFTGGHALRKNSSQKTTVGMHCFFIYWENETNQPTQRKHQNVCCCFIKNPGKNSHWKSFQTEEALQTIEKCCNQDEMNAINLQVQKMKCTKEIKEFFLNMDAATLENDILKFAFFDSV